MGTTARPGLNTDGTYRTNGTYMTDIDKSRVSYRSRLLAMTMRARRVAVSPVRRIVRSFPVIHTWKDFGISVVRAVRSSNIAFSLPDACSGIPGRDAMRTESECLLCISQSLVVISLAESGRPSHCVGGGGIRSIANQVRVYLDDSVGGREKQQCTQDSCFLFHRVKGLPPIIAKHEAALFRKSPTGLAKARERSCS